MSSLRSMIHLSLALGLAAAVALPAAAADEVKVAETAVVDKKERKICETIMTGTRIRSQRVCMTREQWRIANDRNRDDLTAGRDQQHIVRYSPSGRSTCSTSSSTAC